MERAVRLLGVVVGVVVVVVVGVVVGVVVVVVVVVKVKEVMMLVCRPHVLCYQ